MNYTEDQYQCLDCDNVFTRTASDEYQTLNCHVLDDDLADIDPICPKCGSLDIGDYESDPNSADFTLTKVLPVRPAVEPLSHSVFGVTCVVVIMIAIYALLTLSRPAANPQAPIATAKAVTR